MSVMNNEVYEVMAIFSVELSRIMRRDWLRHMARILKVYKLSLKGD